VENLYVYIFIHVYNLSLQNFIGNPPVKEFWKSVCTCQSYDQKSSVLFSEIQCTSRGVGRQRAIAIPTL